jgi:hypothetical protein
LDGIYEYIVETLIEPGIAAKLIDSLEEAIFSLESMPQFTVVYRVAETKKRVLVVTVRYSKSQF